mmetsp:Transcript_23995/g.36570  ORF Transcript_23995/g.36570 Transcript_23995/m.36570 type:complete len:85 (+) Transcript_23995:1214-1468(+)
MDEVRWEDYFKDLPESVLTIEKSYRSLAEARLSQIVKFQKDRTETIYDETFSAPSSATSRESQRRLRYLTNIANKRIVSSWRFR